VRDVDWFWCHLYSSDLAQARDNLHRVKERALETNDPDLLLAYAERAIGHFRYTNDPVAVLAEIEEFRQVNQMNLDPEQDLYLQLVIAALYIQNQTNLDKAQTILLALDQNPKAEAFESTIQQQLGDLYQSFGQYPLALEFYTQALRMDQRREFQARIYNNMGNVAGYLEDWNQSIAHYQRAAQLHEESGLVIDQVAVLANLGPTYRSAGQFQQALDTYQQAINALESIDSPDLEAQVQMNLGNLYVDLDRPEDALKALERSLQICTEEGYDFCIMLNHLNIGFVHYLNKDFSKALESYDLTSQDLESMGDPYIERQLMDNYSDLYRDTGDFEKALTYADRFQALDRQLVNAEAKTAAEEIQTRYETELKDAELAIQAEKIQRQQLQLRLGIVLAIVLVGLLAITIAALSFRTRTLQSLYERNQDLLLQNEVNQRFGQVAGEQAASPVGSEASTEENEEAPASLERVFEKLTQALSRDHIYRDPNLSLGELANHIASNSTYVSNAISQFTHSNFNNLVNYYRIMDARRQLQNAGSNTQIAELVHHCGFNSKASFYRAFSKYVGMSPSQYLQRVKADQASKIQ